MGCGRSVYYYCFSPEPGVCVFFWVGEFVENLEMMLELASEADEGTE